LISCLCHFLLTLNSTSVLAQSTDLKAKVDGVAADLRAAPAPNADLKKSLLDLRSAIDVLEAKAPADIAADMAAFLNRAEEIAPIAERLAKEPTKITPVLAAKASELIVAAQKIDVIDPTTAAIHRAAALSEALKSNIIKTYPALSDAINALLGDLEAVEQVDFLKTVSRRAASLTTLLTGAGTVPPTSIEAMQHVASLQAAILAYRKHGDPKVDIVFAEYGDLRDRNSRSKRRQVCDATAAMRKLCQGHTNCALPATPGTMLCPQDPAEFVSAADKGAWILFRCVDSLLNVYPPPALPGMVAGQGNSFWVALRSSNEEFVCVPPRLND
jgi:hypothetical protein